MTYAGVVPRMLLGYTLYLQPTFMFNQVDVDLDSLFDVVVDHSMVVIPEEIRRCYGGLFDNAVKLQSASRPDARNEIIGPQEKYVSPGSTLQLHCVIKKATVTPSYLFWYHNHRMINYDIEQGIKVNIDLVEHESWLEIQCVSKQHSGNYNCESINALSARVLVHVIEGDNPAVMQHSTTTCISHRKSIFCVILVLLKLSTGITFRPVSVNVQPSR
ncbi:hemicentin-1-like [Vespula squamosa]|uniref:Hemicentin-1-like n=1 Tax=Vespula squamosa TaxID=30214 RepID=A0ABD2AQB9_VESSQ